MELVLVSYRDTEPHGWRRRVLPPGPIGLLRRPFIAIAGLRRHPEYRGSRAGKKGPGRASGGASRRSMDSPPQPGLDQPLRANPRAGSRNGRHDGRTTASACDLAVANGRHLVTSSTETMSERDPHHRDARPDRCPPPNAAQPVAFGFVHPGFGWRFGVRRHFAVRPRSSSCMAYRRPTGPGFRRRCPVSPSVADLLRNVAAQDLRGSARSDHRRGENCRRLETRRKFFTVCGLVLGSTRGAFEAVYEI